MWESDTNHTAPPFSSALYYLKRFKDRMTKIWGEKKSVASFLPWDSGILAFSQISTGSSPVPPSPVGHLELRGREWLAEPLNHSHFQMILQLHRNRSPGPRDQHASETPRFLLAEEKIIRSYSGQTKDKSVISEMWKSCGEWGYKRQKGNRHGNSPSDECCCFKICNTKCLQNARKPPCCPLYVCMNPEISPQDLNSLLQIHMRH